MSSTTASKRPAPGTREPSSPYKPLTPQFKAQVNGTPLPQVPGDSPERANKRAKLNNGSPSDTKVESGLNGNGTLAPPPTLGQVGRGMSGGWGGAVWVTDRIAELEGLYKECIVAATLFLQYRTYSQKLGLDARTPLHVSERLELAWTKYGSLRAHIETYLLQCAQAAKSPDKPLPLPSSLVPGLAPLPSTPSIPQTASNLLHTTPHAGRSGPVTLERLLAADPAKGLVGYEKGQVVFPGVPSDIAMPTPTPVDVPAVSEEKVGNEPGGLGGSEVMPISLPGVDYGATQEQGTGLGIGLGDVGGMELDSLGLAELSALINGDGSMPEGGGLDQAQNPGIGGATGREMGQEASRLLDSLNQYTNAQNEMLVGPPLDAPPQPPANSAPAPPGIDPMLSNFQAQPTLPPPPPQPLLPQPQPFNPPPQQQPTIPSPTQAFDFDFSTIEGADSLDPLEGLADIDFNELAGMFGGSGRTTRIQSPAGGAMSATTQPPEAQPDLGLALSNLYPAGAQPQATAAFDATLGGIDLDDFDFTGADGEGGMPGVDGDEFESMFAEFK